MQLLLALGDRAAVANIEATIAGTPSLPVEQGRRATRELERAKRLFAQNKNVTRS